MKKPRRRRQGASRAQYVEGQREGSLWDSHAFHGELEFDVAVYIMSQLCVRRAKAVYAHTPAWGYLDPVTGGPRVEGESTMYRLEVMTSTDGGYEPEWVEIGDLLQNGVMPDDVSNRIIDAIDAQCRGIDAERRASAGQ